MELIGILLRILAVLGNIFAIIYVIGLLLGLITPDMWSLIFIIFLNSFAISQIRNGNNDQVS